MIDISWHLQIPSKIPQFTRVQFPARLGSFMHFQLVQYLIKMFKAMQW